ncbi:hypothetical protein [Saccharothrix sp.]|uniref:hypothetical protein n=1 Tax=Saccharothrix sp. TaxID=1873460 RepID=UPI002810FD35|nr:hypothetical protein [Saccharothrix sp.]
MADHLADTGMIELALAALRSPTAGPGADAIGEIRRRWDAATVHQDLAWSVAVDGHVDYSVAHPDFDPMVIERARCLLGAFTLVFELWELQRAGVEPDALYLDPDATTRLSTLLTRDLHPRGGTDLALVLDRHGRYTARTDPRRTARRYLAHWAQLALFAHPADLYDHQYRLTGLLHPDFLEHQHVLCSHALARLHGPWSPDAVLSGPSPAKPYWLPRPTTAPRSDEPLLGLDIALGRPGDRVTTDEVRISQAVAEAEVAAEIHRLGDAPNRMLSTLVPAPHQDPGGLSLHLRLTAEFLAAALGVTRLAADHVLRIDGRTVAAHDEERVLMQHAVAAADDTGTSLPTTVLTAAGLYFAFHLDPELDRVLGQVDAVGIAHHVEHVEDVRDMLALLRRPDAPSVIAAMWLLGTPDRQDHATRMSTAWWPPRHTPRHR